MTIDTYNKALAALLAIEECVDRAIAQLKELERLETVTLSNTN